MRCYLLQLLFFFFLTTNSANAQRSTAPPHEKQKSIYLLEKIKLGGVPQSVLITGKDVHKPILLFVHGGPGFSEMAFIRKYNQDLDKHFLVVNWDQRGTNLSYSQAIAKSSVNMNQIIADGHELVEILKRRFGQKKVFLVGHSWGSVVGVLMCKRFPEDFYTYVGIGQVANMQENERVSFQYAQDNAAKHDNKKALAELKSIKPYPAPGNTLKQLYIARKWMQYYGGAVYGARGFEPLFRGIGDGKNPLYDTARAEAGTRLSMDCLWRPLLQIDLMREAGQLKVPVVFILGRHDYNVPYELAEQYLKQLKAPSKKIIYFENSAHMPCFEEPRKFNEIMAGMVAAKRIN